VIADPDKSHFFNTDCISCHTETRRSMELLKTKDIPGIDSLPHDSWNACNFDCSPAGASVEATAARLTAAETAAVVTVINSELRVRQAVDESLSIYCRFSHGSTWRWVQQKIRQRRAATEPEPGSM
jgi:hypothetical protein